MEVDLLPWTFPWKLVELDLLAQKLVEAFLKMHIVSTVGGSGSFDQLQLLRVDSVEASNAFYIPLHTSTYFHEYHKLPGVSTRRA